MQMDSNRLGIVMSIFYASSKMEILVNVCCDQNIFIQFLRRLSIIRYKQDTFWTYFKLFISFISLLETTWIIKINKVLSKLYMCWDYFCSCMSFIFRYINIYSLWRTLKSFVAASHMIMEKWFSAPSVHNG